MDVRFDVPLYTLAEAARILDMAPSTLRYWVHEKELVTSLPRKAKGDAYLPFMAIAQAKFTLDMRQAGLTLHAVEEGVEALRDALGRDWLQFHRLAHDGRDILVRLADTGDQEWSRARDGQVGIPGVIEFGMRNIRFDQEGRPERVVLTQFEGADVVVDPRFAFGQPMIEDRGVRVEDIAHLFFAGESVDVVSEEFGVSRETVEAVVRAYGRRAS